MIVVPRICIVLDVNFILATESILNTDLTGFNLNNPDNYLLLLPMNVNSMYSSRQCRVFRNHLCICLSGKERL